MFLDADGIARSSFPMDGTDGSAEHLYALIRVCVLIQRHRDIILAQRSLISDAQNIPAVSPQLLSKPHTPMAWVTRSFRRSGLQSGTVLKRLRSQVRFLPGARPGPNPLGDYQQTHDPVSAAPAHASIAHR
jgi:hypothetical protein